MILQPDQFLVVDLYNPGLQVTVEISGVMLKDNKPIYLHREVVVPTFSGSPTSIVIPLYYDILQSVSCWRPTGTFSPFTCYASAHIVQGSPSQNSRVASLFSGWFSDSSPIAYPPINQIVSCEGLSGKIRAEMNYAANPYLYLSPQLGMSILPRGFRGTFTTDAVPGNRYIMLGVDDGSSNMLYLGGVSTPILPTSTVAVYGTNSSLPAFSTPNIIVIPIPDYIIDDPYRFVCFVDGASVGDAWSFSFLYYQPIVTF